MLSQEMSDADTFNIVILSARASNLVPCVQSALANESTLSPRNIIVINDGARVEAESKLPAVRWVQGAQPFIFARNANIGIRAACSDVILLNDDAKLLTSQGFTKLVHHARRRPNVGVCSAGIRGMVGNPMQISFGSDEIWLESRTLAFVCVYISKHAYDRVGPLDERFTGYGFEDNDFCERVLSAGLQLGIWSGCIVDHSGQLPSTFRTRPDIQSLFQQNLNLYRDKWGERT